MDLILITIVSFLVAFFLLALGQIFMNKPIKGSCGGLNAVLGSSACDICEHKKKCLEKPC